jgi:ATP-dependent DNA ligase
VQPIAPTWRKEPFDDPGWLFDFKYDGFRALYYIEPSHNRLISRNGNLLTRFDALGGALAAELDVDEARIDGEVIVVDENWQTAVLRSPPQHADTRLCRTPDLAQWEFADPLRRARRRAGGRARRRRSEN